MTGRKYRIDGTLIPRSARPAPAPPDAETLAALERFTDGLPEALRAFRDLNLLTPTRRYRIEEALRHRTRSLTVALHGIHDPHNQAAVMRSSEGMGLQDLHVVDDGTVRFKPSKRITQNAHRWIDVHRHESFVDAAEALRRDGFTLLAAALTPEARPFHALDFTGRIALVLGNEAEGLPPAVIDACDGAFVIPMYGLGQSLNVSVAAAIVVAHAVEARRRAWGDPGDLDEAEKMALRRRFYVRAAGRVPEALRRRVLGEGE